MKAHPYRADFYKELGSDKTKVDKQMVGWLNALEGIVMQMKTEYVTKNYGQI
jgi:hypothetical protein